MELIGRKYMFYRLLAMYDKHCPSCFCSPSFLLLLRPSFRIPTNRWQTTGIPATSNSSQLDSQSKQSSTSDPLDCQNPRQTEPDLLYLNILKDVMKGTMGSRRHYTTSNTPYRSRPEDNFTPENCLWPSYPNWMTLTMNILSRRVSLIYLLHTICE
jgi:hypothetical protein